MKILPTNQNEVPENSTNLQDKIASNSLKYGGTGLAGNSCSLSPHPDKEEAGRTKGVERYF